ncbi:MAG TPA: agmatinase family protein [Phycisphaerales bacterium]|nr:agmatinase family protein [Phycisphaerales bacterium]
MPFDPDAAAKPGTGIFGLPTTREEARIILIPVPFDATTSYGGGASGGPEAVLAASAQVDLFDIQFGRVYEAGLFMEAIDESVASLSRKARAAAKPVIEIGGAEPGDAEHASVLTEVNRACDTVTAFVHERTDAVLREGKIPAIVGGDHSTPFGAIRACAEHVGKEGLGILQIDAHMDLRDAFEGFDSSHASIMFNVIKHIPGVKKLVQVGIRDFGEGERNISRDSGGRVITHYDFEWSRRMMQGERFESLCKEAIGALPHNVYVSFDIDGLDPALCPHTGTPVPGGFSFHQASLLLELLARSGRRIVGFDLNEVSPSGSDGDEWDANVGARLLYKLCGAAASNPNSAHK